MIHLRKRGLGLSWKAFCAQKFKNTTYLFKITYNNQVQIQKYKSLDNHFGPEWYSTLTRERRLSVHFECVVVRRILQNTV